jgi:hypothetical protein
MKHKLLRRLRIRHNPTEILPLAVVITLQAAAAAAKGAERRKKGVTGQTCSYAEQDSSRRRKVL